MITSKTATDQFSKYTYMSGVYLHCLFIVYDTTISDPGIEILVSLFIHHILFYVLNILRLNNKSFKSNKLNIIRIFLS